MKYIFPDAEEIPFTRVQILYIDITTYDFDSNLATQSLIVNLKWLFENAANPPILKQGLLLGFLRI